MTPEEENKRANEMFEESIELVQDIQSGHTAEEAMIILASAFVMHVNFVNDTMQADINPIELIDNLHQNWQTMVKNPMQAAND